ncbi:sulfurtransferase [Haloarchaeobius iranensis]|uniref:Sulfurtransferase n=1 Tax=Haloarchaeobius iranensis TaxID=996166 RepID=A0A1G9YM88_9EURY|nr:sulfurtransferase [Haloarchaeobius iranensis]SDN10117.1 thiosulfate/3-mercaptopyruvate sulfurtransferase [Haloarchaeobius iranensis]
MTPTDSPETALVSPEWVAERLDEFAADDDAYRLVEVDVNTRFYDRGHAPGAVGLDWERDLRAADRHDILSAAELERLLGESGISEDTTVVAYGDNSNWFATHFYWQLTYYGHSDVRIMDGGRGYWTDHSYPLSTDPVDPPTVEYGRSLSPPASPDVRASRDDVFAAVGSDTKLVDVRLAEEYRGEITAPPGIDEVAMRGGHVPGALNVFWGDNIQPDEQFKSREELRALYREYGIAPTDDVIVYCRIGERSSITWFVLSELLGYDSVRNYDGSWTEWGNMIGMPIERGE